MILFVKKRCQRCEYIKQAVKLDKLNVEVVELTPNEVSLKSVEALASLAWHELVKESETTLPILVLDNSSTITSAIEIKKYLLNLKEGE
jgi:arsenate reductase-like glutaredoxin family protein